MQELAGRAQYAVVEGDDATMPAIWAPLCEMAFPVFAKIAREAETPYGRALAIATIGQLGQAKGKPALDLLIEALGGPRPNEPQQEAAAIAIKFWWKSAAARARPALQRLVDGDFSGRAPDRPRDARVDRQQGEREDHEDHEDYEDEGKAKAKARRRS